MKKILDKYIIKEAVKLAQKFNGDIKIWNNEEIKKNINYIE